MVPGRGFSGVVLLLAALTSAISAQQASRNAVFVYSVAVPGKKAGRSDHLQQLISREDMTGRRRDQLAEA